MAAKEAHHHGEVEGREINRLEDRHKQDSIKKVIWPVNYSKSFPLLMTSFIENAQSTEGDP